MSSYGQPPLQPPRPNAPSAEFEVEYSDANQAHTQWLRDTNKIAPSDADNAIGAFETTVDGGGDKMDSYDGT